MAKWKPMLNGNPAPVANFASDNDFDKDGTFDDGTGLEPADANFKNAGAAVAAKLATLVGEADAMALVGQRRSLYQPASGTHTYTR